MMTGYYRFRVMLYQPVQPPWDIKWQPPGQALFSSIPAFVRFGQQQPLAAQLLQQVLRHMTTGSNSSGGSSSSSRGMHDHSSSSWKYEHGSSSSSSNGSSRRLQSVMHVALQRMQQQAAALWGRGSAPSSAAGAGPPGSSSHSCPGIGDGEAAAIDSSCSSSTTTTTNYYYYNSNASKAGAMRKLMSASWSFFPFLFPFPFWSSQNSFWGSSTAAPGALGSAAAADNWVVLGRDGAEPAASNSSDSSSSSRSSSHSTAVVPSSLAAAGVVSPSEVFSVAFTFVPSSPTRILIPSPNNLQFSHSGILPSLELPAGQLQHSILGYYDAADTRGGYGLIQGWLDWRDLNPAAVTWLQGLEMVNSSSGSSMVGGDQAGVGAIQGQSSIAVGLLGVQFKLSCQSCSLHVDGMAVAGGAAVRDSQGALPASDSQESTCIVPSRRMTETDSSSSSSNILSRPLVPASQQLLHLEILFAADRVASAAFSVLARPCATTSAGAEASSSSSSWVPVKAAGVRGLSLGVSSLSVQAAAAAPAAAAAFEQDGAVQEAPATGSAGTAGIISSDSNSGRYTRGMKCLVTAVVPPSSSHGPEDSSSSSSSSSDNRSSAAESSKSKVEQRAVLLTAEDLEQITLLNRKRDTSARPSSSSSSSNSNATAAELTARAIGAARGIQVQQLVPDWATSHPAGTVYGFSCACYWNGSWLGTVSAAVKAGGSGAAALYLAGWPVASAGLPAALQKLYGPSDIRISSYSTLRQQQMLAAGSSSADPLMWAAAGSSAAAGGAAGLGYRMARQSSGTTGVFDLGVLDGAVAVGSDPGQDAGTGSSSSSSSKFHQLLVLQGEGLTAHSEVVVLTATEKAAAATAAESAQWVHGPFVMGDTAGGGSSSSGGGDGDPDDMTVASSANAAAALQGWLPRAWDAWVPAASAAAA
jgi:hypothetical protein